MRRADEPLLRMAAVILPLALVAFAAHSMLKPPAIQPSLSAAFPTVEEMDSLGKYLSSPQPKGVPAVDFATGFRRNDPDPFGPVYSAAMDSASAVALPRASTSNPLVVSAILISSDRRLAVVNEALVSIGNTLPGGSRVTAIESDHIEIVTPGGVRRLLTVRDTNGP